MSTGSSRWHRLQTVFEGALATPTEERPAFLASACGSDLELRQEVEAMLEADDPAHALAIERLVPDAGDASESDPLIGMRLGPWRIVGLLGRGGMGVVYAAERADGQYEQRVALKIVFGPAAEHRARPLQAERHILARLSHPNIARLLDAGFTPEGSTYMVMEYVDGLPIDAYCDRQRLTVEERLRLFRIVCAAAQHAHQALVVHRDLKPSNIFVSRAGEVKLLDFGIAKLLEEGSTLPAATLRDNLLTPEYAAPEQLRSEPVTTATDVYALGVVLYELLTGRRPFVRSAPSVMELERLISTRDATPPSGVVGRQERACSGSDADAIASVRRTTPARLVRRLRGDLDRVVLKALKPAPERRYGSAGQLADEIGRFLEGRPVVARPDTTGYRLARFVARNRLAVAAGGLIVVFLASFGILAALQAQRVRVERDRARIEQARAEHVVRVLVDLFRTANPDVVPNGDRQSIGEFLDRSEKRVLQQLESSPDLSTTMRQVLGQMHWAKSDNRHARELFESALADRRRISGDDAAETLSVQVDLGELLMWLDERDRGKTLLDDALARVLRTMGEDNTLAARVYHALAVVQPTLAESARYVEKAVAISRRLPNAVEDRVRHVTELAVVYQRQSRLEESGRLFEEALHDAEAVNGGRSMLLIGALNDSAAYDNRVGAFARAEAKHRRTLALASDLVGPDSFQVANAHNNLAVVLVYQSRMREAAEAFNRSYEAHLAIFGATHWRTANTMRNIAVTLLLLDDPAGCETWMRRAIHATESSTDDRMKTYMRGQLARCLVRQHRTSEAIPMLTSAIGRLEAMGADAASDLASLQLWLARAFLEADQLDRAEPLLVAAAEYHRRARDPFHPARAEADCELAMILDRRGRRDEALSLVERCVPLLATYGQMEPWRKQSAQGLLARLRAGRAIPR